MRLILTSLLAVCVLTVGCGGGTITPPTFDPARAFSYLEKQVAFGPRVPGSEASRACRAMMADHFRNIGLPVDSQPFDFFDPYSQAHIPMVNLRARLHVSDKAETILLVAHYDSRPRTDHPSNPALADQPIAGANDGASGVAVLMELASLCQERAPAVNVDFLMVDGEDWGKSGDPDLYCLGSKRFAAQGIRGQYRFAIVVDMVGDRDQRIYREGYTDLYHRSINDLIWHTARDLGIATFADSVKQAIIDDHLSFTAGGVLSTVIIDFDYPYWHTDRDTPDKCSGESLANVGRVLAHIIYNPQIWPKS